MHFPLRLSASTEPIIFYSLKSTLFLLEKTFLIKKSIQERYWKLIIIMNDNFISFYYLFEPRIKNKRDSEINGIELISFHVKTSQNQDNNWEEDAVLVLLGYQKSYPVNIEYMQIINSVNIVSKNQWIQEIYNFYSKILNKKNNIHMVSKKKNMIFIK